MYKIFVKNNNSQDDKEMISLLSWKMSCVWAGICALPLTAGQVIDITCLSEHMCYKSRLNATQHVDRVLQFPDMREVWTGASARALRWAAGLLSQSRYFKYMQVYVLPMECREVAESKGTTEIVSGFTWSWKAEVWESNSFWRLENIETCET